MKPLRILVVEDDALQGMMLGEILEELGHKVCAVTSTVSGAVAAAERYRPQLLIVDQWLSDGSGLSVIDNVCKNSHVPHLFVSGDVSGIKQTRPDAVVVPKPYRVIELEAVINESLIGGFVLETEGNLVDASILRDLKDIKKQFLNNDYIHKIR